MQINVAIASRAGTFVALAARQISANETVSKASSHAKPDSDQRGCARMTSETAKMMGMVN
jgi:hypothetical protein